MAIKTIPNPEMLKNPTEITDVIVMLEEFEKLYHQPAAIVERQNLSLGASYSVIAESEAKSRLQKWQGREIYLKYWSKQHFLDLQSRYMG